MKHLFTIHSPLTFLVAYSIIKTLEIPKEDVILLSNNYKVPFDDYRVVPAYQQVQNQWWKKLMNLNFPKAYDRYLNSITNKKPFTAYIDLLSYYQKIIITHPLCQQFHFFEEGNSAYMSEDDLADLTWEDFTGGMDFRVGGIRDRNFIKSLIRVFRGYNLRLISIPYHYMAFANFRHTRFYCFSENAFFNAPHEKKIVLEPKKEDHNIITLANGMKLENEIIWIDGSSQRYTGLDDTYYQDAIERGILHLVEVCDQSKPVYVKLRPGEKNLENNHLVRKLKLKGLLVSVLPDDIIIECLFMISKNCLVIGNLTSSLEYAHVFGHEAWSIYGLFEKQPRTFFDRMDGFWQHVKRLENK